MLSHVIEKETDTRGKGLGKQTVGDDLTTEPLDEIKLTSTFCISPVNF